MPVIKRYSNRKLYATEAKQYVTLDWIAERLRQGEEIRVVDHTTGEDLTALTLAQIILDQEKKGGGLLPRVALTRLVQAGGDTINTLRRALLSPADFARDFARDFGRQVDDEILRRIQVLIDEGRLSEQDGRRVGEQLVAQGQARSQARESLPSASEGALKQALAERGVPTRTELRRLSEQIEALAASLEELE